LSADLGDFYFIAYNKVVRKEFHTNGLRWIHISKPADEDIQFINGLFPFNPFVVESIISPTLHPLVDDFDDHLFLIMHFPIIYKNWQSNEIAEVDFLITKNLLITVTYTNFESIEQILGLFNTNEKLKKQITRHHTGFILHYIIDRLFQKLIDHLDFMEEEITIIEDRIFEKRSVKMIEEISHIRRDILDFRRPLKPQSAVLKIFVEKAEKFFGKPMAPYLTDIIVTEDRIMSIIDNQKETVDALYQTNESLMSSNISSIITILTIFSAVIMPLNLMASLWGMNHQTMPLRDGQFDFWIIMAIMAIIAVSLLVLFKKKRWL